MMLYSYAGFLEDGVEVSFANFVEKPQIVCTRKHLPLCLVDILDLV